MAFSTVFRSLRLVAVALVTGVLVLVPGSPGSADPVTVTVPITGAVMTVNGTATTFPAAPGAVLTGTYDPDSGAFTGNLVLPALGQTGTTSLGDGFALSFAPVNAPVTGTIPQTGTGTIGTVGWTVEVGLTGPLLTISGCSVTIAPMSFTTTFDAVAGTLALTSVGYPIPGVTCTGGAVDEADVEATLAIPTTATELVLSAVDASSLRASAESATPSFTG